MCHYGMTVDTNIIFSKFTVPSVQVEHFICTSDMSRRSSCTGQLSGDCHQYNGPGTTAKLTVTGVLECQHTVHRSSLSAAILKTVDHQWSVTKLMPGLSYTATVTIGNEAGNSTRVTNTTFTTAPESNVFLSVFF